MRQRAAICCFLPPHILRSIAERGDAAERDQAHAALENAATSRGERIAAPMAAVIPIRTSRSARRIFDAARARRLPGRIVRDEGSAKTGDRAADEAYDGAGATLDFFRDVLGRESVDGKGMRIDSTVHYGTGFANAMWNGSQMIYGDGDGRYFKRFTASLDVIAHELTHGVTQHLAALDSFGEAGAINEHVADVFGVLVRQYSLRQSAARADWLVGSGLYTRRVHGVAVRSMKEPGTAYDDPVLGRDPQPAHMRDYVRTEFDNGGVHINSGILNHAFYRAATAIGGNAWDAAGKVWFRALSTGVRADVTFTTFATATLAAGADVCGTASRECEAIAAAWTAVGVEAKEPRKRTRAKVGVPREAEA